MAAPALTTAERADRVLADLVPAARTARGDTLDSRVLYGSAAAGRLRPAADVNVIFVLNRFDAARIDALGDPVRIAQAAIRLAPMVLLRDEIPHAAAAFAVKFADIVRRHRVLHGTDPFADLPIARDRLIARLTQVLLNLRLRLRASYLTQHTFDDQLIGVTCMPRARCDRRPPRCASSRGMRASRRETHWLPLFASSAIRGSRTWWSRCPSRASAACCRRAHRARQC